MFDESLKVKLKKKSLVSMVISFREITAKYAYLAGFGRNFVK